MTVPVELSELRGHLSERGLAYLLTVGSDGRAHSVAVKLEWNGDLLVARPGNSSLANAKARPLVALLMPPSEPGDYTLIVDAEVVSATGTGQGDNVLTLRPTKAVLHRPAAGELPGCGSDCVPVYGAG